MADGMFDSGGSSSSGSSYNDYSTNNYGSSSSLSAGQALVVLGIIVAVVLVVLFVQAVALENERELDRTVYVETSKGNFDRWLATRDYNINDGSLWFEEGSSHRDNYHCKGGQFQTTAGADVTFCCSVVAGDNPPCLVITP